jgi:predicted MFS family arabinose efflux permease
MTAIAEGPLTLRQERLAVAALTLGAFAMSVNNSVLGPLLKFLEPAVHPPGSGGVLIGSASLAGAAGGLLLGPWVDRVGRRPPLVVGMAVFAAASLLYLLVWDFWSLLAARIASGFAVGIVYTAASAALADLVPYVRRGAAMGVFSAGNYLAAPIGFPIAQGLATLGSWRATFVLQALFAAGVLACFWRLLPAGVGRGGRRVRLLDVLRMPQVPAGLLSMTLYVGCMTAVVQWLASWLDDTALLPKERQTPLWIVFGLCAAAGSLGLARLSDRYGKRRFVLITTLVEALWLLALGWVHTVWQLVVLGVPFALLVAARSGPTQALVSELVPGPMRGTLMGMRAAGVSIGIGLLTIGAGALYRTGGGGHSGFLLLAIGASATVLTAWALVLFGLRGRA